MTAPLRLFEPVPVEDDLCTSLALIEDLGFGARFVLTTRQTLYETNDALIVVKRKIVLPYEGIAPGVQMAVAFLARRTATAAGKSPLWVVL
jgi:hypothetical protein